MLLKQVLVLFSVLLLTEIGFLTARNLEKRVRYASPYALIDDAEAALDDLYQLIIGAISVAHDQLEDVRSDINANRLYVGLKAALDIQTERQALDDELTSIKNLAQTAGADISPCLGDRETHLSQIPSQYLDQVYACIAEIRLGSDKMINGSIYSVDVVYSKVSSIDFQLGRCSPRDSNCISAVMRQIEAARESLPLEIDLQVNNATESSEIVKINIQGCADTSLAAYVYEGSTTLLDISNCVDAIIS